MSALRTYLWSALIALPTLAVGCGSPLVGLECQDGYTQCGQSCYNLLSDDNHCGGCNVACGAQQHCEMNMCVAGPRTDAGPDIDASRDGGLPDGANPDGSRENPDGSRENPDGSRENPDGSLDGSNPDGSNPDGSTPDGSNPDGSTADGGIDNDAMVPPPVVCFGDGSPLDCICGIGTIKCGNICVNPLTDHDHCGDPSTPMGAMAACTNVCRVDQLCNSGVCNDICTLPLYYCGGVCVDYSTDDNNCGTNPATACGNVCASTAQCIAGVCTGKLTGHVVAIGHDMTGPLRVAIRQIVANSVFLPARQSVRVLVYDAATSVLSRAGVVAAIQSASLAVGRQYTLTVALPDTVTAALANTDVFVIDPQQGALDTDLTALGVSWSSALSTFLGRGGVVVLFDGGPSTSGPNTGTWQILRAATYTDVPPAGPMLQVSGATPLLEQLALIYNVRPGDAIGANVPTPYQAAGVTSSFTLDSMLLRSHFPVIADQPAAGAPIVLHVLFPPPQ